MAVIRHKDLAFEPLSEADFPLLQKWLSAPHVYEQWHGASAIEEMRSKYRDKIASDWQKAFIVSVGGVPFGYIQCYRASRAGADWWPSEPDTTMGIDQFIGDEQFLGRGLGASMVEVFSDWLLQQPNTEKIIADPSPGNARAISCYRRAGFKDVGVVTTPDGPALLMEKKLDRKRPEPI